MENETESQKSFYNLLTTMYRAGYGNHNDLSIIVYPLSFLRSGYYTYNSGALGDQKTSGHYWSLRGYSSGTNLNAYGLVFLSTRIIPQSGLTRGYGFPLRCLAR